MNYQAAVFTAITLLIGGIAGATPERLDSESGEAQCLQMQTDYAAWEQSFKADWDVINLKRFRDDRRLTDSSARVLASLDQSEKAEWISFLRANPVAQGEPLQTVALAILADQDANRRLVEDLKRQQPEYYAQLNRSAPWIPWASMPTAPELAAIFLDQLNHPDPIVSSRSLDCLGSFDPSLWQDAVISHARSADTDDRSRIAFFFMRAIRPPSRIQVAAAIELFTEWAKTDPMSVRFALRRTIEWHPAYKDSLVDAYCSGIRVVPKADWGKLLPILATVSPEHVTQFLDAYVLAAASDSEAHKWTRPASIFFEWAKDLSPQKRLLVDAWRNHPVLGEIAWDIYALINRGTHDETVATALFQHARNTQSWDDAYAISEIGGKTATRLALQLHNEAPRKFATVGMQWVAHGITVHKALEAAHAEGWITEVPSSAAVNRVQIRHGLATPSPYRLWLAVLEDGGRSVGFDQETGTFPCRHDVLMMKIGSQLKTDFFRPNRAMEVWKKEQNRYEVLLENNKKWIRFSCSGELGDWYDLESVIKAVNFVLAEAGHTERIFNIEHEGQNAQLLLCSKNSLDRISKKLQLPKGATAEELRQRAKAFERLVEERLNVKETVK